MAVWAEKNANRRVNMGPRRSRARRLWSEARSLRRRRLDGAFGNAAPYVWNTCVTGTTGRFKDETQDSPTYGKFQ